MTRLTLCSQIDWGYAQFPKVKKECELILLNFTASEQTHLH